MVDRLAEDLRLHPTHRRRAGRVGRIDRSLQGRRRRGRSTGSQVDNEDAGGSPCDELVVPATALRLAQWAGRAIRSEEDQAHVYCYDKRLGRTSYGQRLLAGLPPFSQQRRAPA